MKPHTMCPYGCRTLQDELMSFKQIAITYFNQILVKFVEQDNTVSALTNRIDQWLLRSVPIEQVVTTTNNGDLMWSSGEANVPHQCPETATDAIDHNVPDAVLLNDDVLESKYCPPIEPGMIPTGSDSQLESCENAAVGEDVGCRASELMDETIAAQFEPDGHFEITPRLQNSTLAYGHSDRDMEPSTSRSTIGMTDDESEQRREMTSAEIRQLYSKTTKQPDGSEVTECGLCRKLFKCWTSTWNIADHIRRRHFVRLFRCGICEVTGHSKVQLAQHLLEFHAGMVNEDSLNGYIGMIFEQPTGRPDELNLFSDV